MRHTFCHVITSKLLALQHFHSSTESLLNRRLLMHSIEGAPNRTSSATSRRRLVSELSSYIHMMLPNSTDKFIGVILVRMRTTNNRRTWGRKSPLVGAIRKNSYEGYTVDWNEKWQ
ncbi:hypothetical protein TNCV_1567001 [Trichonephila clavipes]|nr:hypothetical protein TNCV_1567001 [Trichonephila clavipes]